MLILNPLETEVSNPENGDSQESSNASWAGRKANCLKNLFSLCPPWWSSQQGWQVFLLGFWEVGICQPPLKSRSTIYFVCHWSKAAGFKSVSWKWVFLIPSYPDSLISWVSPACHNKDKSQQCLGWSVFLTSPLYCCDPGFVCCLAVTNDPWTLLCSVASSPLTGSRGCVCSTACWTLLREIF